MKLSYIKRILPLGIMVLSMGLSSCTKDLDVEPIDPNKDTTVDAQKLFNKCYAAFSMEGFGPGNSELDLGDPGLSVCYRLIWNANELTTDEAICGWSDKGIDQYDFNTYTPNNESIYGLYWRLCQGVSLCNHYLETCADFDPTMTAEIHFMRAFYYSYMLDFFGNPSFTETVSSENPRQIQSAELFNWIVNELKSNMDGMLAPSIRKKGEANYGRADQSAAWMLLSRLYLNAEKYTGEAHWAEARDYAKKVIDESKRSIWMGDDAINHKSANGNWSAYQMLFLADNDETGAFNESIFAVICDGRTTASWGSSLFLVASTRDGAMEHYYPQMTTEAWGGNRSRLQFVEKFISTDDLDALENWKSETIIQKALDDRALIFGDYYDEKKNENPKYRKYTNDKVSEFTDGLAINKFSSQRSDNGLSSDTKFTDNDIMIMRLAEAYLNFAEAEARASNSNVTLTQGTGYINELRKRANNPKQLGSYTLDEVLDERSRELYYEGLRRTDLIRYGYYGGSSLYLWQWKGGVKEGTQFGSYRNIFPIPAIELGTNSNLRQNPGY